MVAQLQRHDVMGLLLPRFALEGPSELSPCAVLGIGPAEEARLNSALDYCAGLHMVHPFLASPAAGDLALDFHVAIGLRQLMIVYRLPPPAPQLRHPAPHLFRLLLLRRSQGGFSLGR